MQLNGYWREYSGQKKEYQQGTFDEEMKKVLEWRNEYQRFLEGEPEQDNAAGE